MIFKPVRKSIFEQTNSFCVIIWEFLPDIIKVYNQKILSFFFVFLIMLHLQTLTPLILLSVNVGPPRENLPFEYAIKGRKIEEAYKVSHKKPRKNFRS